MSSATANASQKKLKPTRYALDYSARFYPVISTKKAQSLFCVGAELDQPVRPDILLKAANDVISRFPSLKVKLKKGYSWHYFEENTKQVKIFPIDGKMLRPIDPNETNGYRFRLSYGGTRVQIDMFHALTDANGALTFLKTLLMRYQELCGVCFSSTSDLLDWRGNPADDETEDSFEKYYKPVSFKDLNLKAMAGGAPHRVKGTPVDDGYLSIVGGVDAKGVLEKAKGLGVSFTAYIAGILAHTIRTQSSSKHPIVIMIPVNLRHIFPSKTMRNFVTFVRIVLHPEKYPDAESLMLEAQYQLSEKSHKNKMEAFISTTVRAQGNLLLKCLPLFLKIFFIRLGRVFMRSRQTIIFSNLGRVSVPKELGVKRFIFNMNVSKSNPQNVGAVTIGDEAVFAFTRAIKETSLPDAFFANLKEQGISIQMQD